MEFHCHLNCSSSSAARRLNDSMSLRNKHNNYSGLLFSTGGYSIPKTSIIEHVAPVVNQSLLAPMNIQVDPTVQFLCTPEKEEIKGLNNRFASFTYKVRLLEQKNKLLQTKWNLLQRKAVAPSDVEPFFKTHITSLQKQLDQINKGNQNLEVEHQTWLRKVDYYHQKYEDELKRREVAENAFVLLNKDVDEVKLSTLNLELILSTLIDEFSFLKTVYDEELQESIKEIFVVVEMKNSRDVNMYQIVLDVKALYEEVAARSSEETEIWYRRKFDQIAEQANQYGSDLHTTKEEIAHLKRVINRLHNEIGPLRAQCATLEESNTEVDLHGQQVMLNTSDRIKDLEEALKRAKLQVVKQIRDYQDLMNLKITLDIERSTYKKLLEGEEPRRLLRRVQYFQTSEERSRLIKLATENCLNPTVLKWLRQNAESDTFIRLVELFDFLKKKINEEDKKNHSDTVNITFSAHGSIGDFMIPASCLLPLPSISDVVLYAPWNCVTSGLGYAIATGRLKPQHRVFCCTKEDGCKLPDEKHRPMKLPDHWNSMRKAGDRMIPNITVSPLRPDDGVWEYFEFYTKKHGPLGRNQIVIPFILPGKEAESVPFSVVTLALSLVLQQSRFKATVHLNACLRDRSAGKKFDREYLEKQYACAIDNTGLTCSPHVFDESCTII